MAGGDTQVKTTQADNEGKSAVLWCMEPCKYDRKSKKNNIQLEMIRCCFCMHWYHEDCLNVKSDAAVVWYCPSCSCMPGNISKILEELLNLREDMKALKADNIKTKDGLSEIETQYENLKKDNTSLRGQVSKLESQLQNTTWENFTNNQKQSLVIGDSLLRDIDEKKLVKTQVISLPGAKVGDILKRLQSDDETYKQITCCVGTNDCANGDFNSDTVMGAYKDVIGAAKGKVTDPKNVHIVSVPPRTDSSDCQERVDILNACLATAATDNDVTFVNNDLTFKLSDGTVNDGYLLGDGVHLNNKGTNRIAKNMQLKACSNVNGNIVKGKRSQNRPQKEESTNEPKDEGWQKVQHKRGPKRQQQSFSRLGNNSRDHQNKRNTSHHNDIKCWFCGEENHVSHNCRHGRKITCHNCLEQGHKAKYCTY